MTANKPNDFNFIPRFSIDLAEGFYQVGYSLAKKIHTEKSYFGFIGLAPAVVNFNLAAELYIKSIFAIQFKRRLVGHKLIKLYRELPRNVKDKLESTYLENKKTLNKEITSYRITIAPANQKSDGPKDPKIYNSISDLLDNHQDSFEKWRYLHEIGKNDKIDYEYDFFSMDCFIRSIKIHLKTINKKDEI